MRPKQQGVVPLASHSLLKDAQQVEHLLYRFACLIHNTPVFVLDAPTVPEKVGCLPASTSAYGME